MATVWVGDKAKAERRRWPQEGMFPAVPSFRLDPLGARRAADPRSLTFSTAV